MYQLVQPAPGRAKGLKDTHGSVSATCESVPSPSYKDFADGMKDLEGGINLDYLCEARVITRGSGESRRVRVRETDMMKETEFRAE